MTPSDDAFVRAFAAEMEAASHEALVELYTWANGQAYGFTDGLLRERAETWAKQVEDSGSAMAVLRATAQKPCPTCGHVA